MKYTWSELSTVYDTRTGSVSWDISKIDLRVICRTWEDEDDLSSVVEYKEMGHGARTYQGGCESCQALAALCILDRVD